MKTVALDWLLGRILLSRLCPDAPGRQDVPGNVVLKKLIQFVAASKSVGIEGRIQIEHWLSLRLASIESLTFSLVFIAVYFLADKTFLLGGSVGCLLLALRLLADSYQQRKASVSSPKNG